MLYTPEGRLENPRYYSHFSISRLNGGVPVQLEYGEGSGLKEIAADGVRLDCGEYMLLTGRRMADGSVLARGELFIQIVPVRGNIIEDMRGRLVRGFYKRKHIIAATGCG